MTYFNTTNEIGTTLKNNVVKAKSQEKEILNYFKEDKEVFVDSGYEYLAGFSVSDLIKTYVKLRIYPITSIRRALTNLTKQGKLIKTDEKRIGMYGRSEYVWKLNENTCASN